VGNLYRIAERLREVQIENIEALDLIRRLDYPESLFYVDPPYVGETRSAPDSYYYELSEREHRELSETLQGLSGYVLLSGYESDLYADLYGSRGWTAVTREALGNSGSKAEEVLWLNPRLAEAREGVLNL
jgi:DNA adenine methylase